MMTTTASTSRQPAMSGGKRGEPTTNLTNVLLTPPMLSDMKGDHAVRQAIGLEGTAEQLYEAYTESHTHTDSGVSVTQMPDIKAGDRLTVDGVTYNVKWAKVQGLTFGFGKTLMLYITEDERA